jgi:hypothetical protein
MTISVGTAYLTLIVGTILPALVSLVTHQLASSKYKTVVLLVLSVLAGVGTQMLSNGGHLVLDQAALTSAGSFGIAWVAHEGLLKPLGLTGTTGLLNSKVPGGLGLKRTSMGAEPAGRHE